MAARPNTKKNSVAKNSTNCSKAGVTVPSTLPITSVGALTSTFIDSVPISTARKSRIAASGRSMKTNFSLILAPISGARAIRSEAGSVSKTIAT